MAANPEWHYAKNNQQQLGPVSSAELKRLAATGGLSPSDLIWKDGMDEWKMAGTVKGLFPQPPATPIPPPLPQNSAINQSSSSSQTSNVADTVKSDLNDFVNTGKRAKDYAVAKTRKTQLTQITLPKAYLALGKDVFESERFQDEFNELVQQIVAKNDEIAKVKASPNERPQATDLKGKIQSGAAQLMAQGQATKLGFQRDSLIRELGKKAFESHKASAGSPELVSPIKSAIEEIEKLDSVIKPSTPSKRTPFWQRVPLAVLLTLCCFPVGLYLVWHNPRLTRRSKTIWIGGFATIFIGMMIFAQISNKRARENLAAADQLWASGDKQAAVSKYRTLVKDHLHIIPESERSLIYGRVIDFDADSGNLASADKLLNDAEHDHVVPSVSSEKARPLIAKRIEEKKKSELSESAIKPVVPTSNQIEQPSKQVVQPSKPVVPPSTSPPTKMPTSLAKGRPLARDFINYLRKNHHVVFVGDKGLDVAGTPFSHMKETLNQDCLMYVGGRDDAGQRVSIIVIETLPDLKVGYVLLGTPFDTSKSLGRGNDPVTPINQLLQVVLPEANVRTVIKDKFNVMFGSVITETFGKAGLGIQIKGKEFQAGVLVDP